MGIVCQSKDIRNLPAELNILKGCRVIEGFLMITLIDRYNETDYDNFTFPELVEITDFLMLYRVQGLKTLGHLFPNLRVIRGNNLVNNYALIIYEMLQLTDISLKSLTSLNRGAVRIEKNPLLCFADTINWVYIANGTQMEDHFIDSNKNINECAVCPSGKKDEKSDGDVSDLECPVSKKDPKKRYCWNRNLCQKICPDACGNRSCDDEGNCCDEMCLGSCQMPNASNCTVCRRLSIGKLDERKCIDTCPPGTYKFEDRRCITDGECRNITRPFATPDDNSVKYPFIPFNGTCSASCPIYYSPGEVNGKRTCISCNGECKKECHGSTIDSISGAQNYRGCAKITGTLVIQIRQGGQNVIKELEQSLSDIEEIEEGLKVIRSYPLISLSFFKKLRVIHGKNVQENYTLYVMDNQNLQSLFGHEVKILSGRLFFHFNSKLCYHEIEALKKDVNDLKNVDKIAIEDVAINSNGDKVACNVTKLVTKISSVMNIGAVIDVVAMIYDDTRVLLGYVLHFKPAPFKNVTLFDGRDACGGDGWRVEDMTSFDRKAKVIQIILTNLKPYTQYAYYVKTYTITTEPYGGQSDIQYFTTMPAQPGMVQKMKVLPNGSSSLIVTWEPPKVLNGKITNYIVKASLIYDDPEILKHRNYCDEPLRKDEEKAFATPTVQKPVPATPPQECACPDDDDSETPPMPNENSDTVEQIINFENEIQNIVYVKRTLVVTGQEPKLNRRRRTIDAAGKYTNQSNTNQLDELDVFPTSQRTVDKEKTGNDFFQSKMVNGYYEEFYNNQTKASVHTFVLEKLRHFSMYSITVQACRDFNDTNFSMNDYCSNIVMLNRRTERKDDADNIDAISFKRVPNSNSSQSTIKLNWNEPKDPNGLILMYTISYKRIDLEHLQSTEQCVTRHMHVNLSGEIPFLQLSNGNYSVWVRATSLAGPGNPSKALNILIDGVKESNTKTIVYSIVGVVLCVILIVGGVCFYLRRKYGPHMSDLKLIASVNPEYVGVQYTQDEWEVERDDVIHLKELGQGSFGMVYEGLLKTREGETVPCAIKTVTENATDRERINFLREASVMKAFDTHHVVRLLGVVSVSQPTLVVMELMAYGDLKAYLRSHRPDADESVQPIGQPPTYKRVLQMALEIADGMAYLAAKKFVHRDLAARNCMVAEDLTVKIGDFGMTRDIYETDYYRKGTKGLLPVRWMAPESLKDGVFTSSSDVFSYGIVLWEIATGASQPYQGLSNDQVLRYVIDGGVMERPDDCPDRLYNLMIRTWQHRPSSRPTFLELVSLLLDEAAPSFRKLSFYYTPTAQEAIQPKDRRMVIDVTTPLRAEEDDFTLDDLAPDEFLMSNVRISKNDGASNSPLRSSLGPVRRLTSSILDHASSKSNKNSPITTVIPSINSQSILSRNGGQFNRGIEFLRNALFYKNGGSNTDNESTEYKKLHSKSEPITKDESSEMTVVGIEDNVGAIKRQNLSNGFVEFVNPANKMYI
ncbi:Insulin-like receptor [Pseudolycoriella hygida]|uniref:Tyrosine-protein kinase receptor n=1 Tax=Pseudolycoriella hygida TaxID=35572 RepID=A0A9Q0MQ46_9DIPT|nr:Insulin-like receptor [Pseudolycoriella hygida]